MRGILLWGLFLLLGSAAGANEPSCFAQFASVPDPFDHGPILIFAGATPLTEPHHRSMNPAQREAAIVLVQRKLLRARHLARSGQWELLAQELYDPSFMSGTGLTSYEPDASVGYLTPSELAEIANSPERLREAKREFLRLAHWQDTPECCRIQGTRLRLVDPQTGMVLPNSKEMLPLTQEGAMLITEEIAHHLQGLRAANNVPAAVSRAMHEGGFDKKLAAELRRELMTNLDYAISRLVSAPGRRALDRAVARFKELHPEGSPGLSAADRVLVTSLPSQLAALLSIAQAGEAGTPESKQFSADVFNAFDLFFTKFPVESEGLMNHIVAGELREADVYFLLRDIYGPKLIDATWRDRYLARQIAERLLTH